MLALFSLENHIALIILILAFLFREVAWFYKTIGMKSAQSLLVQKSPKERTFLCSSRCLCSIFLWLEWPKENFVKYVWIILFQILP